MNKSDLDRIRIPFLMVLVGSILLLVMILLPYASAKDDYKQFLKSDPDAYYASEIKMTNASAVNISMLEYSRIYVESARQGVYRSVSILCIILISLFAFFSLLTLIMSLLKKQLVSLYLIFLHWQYSG